MVRIAVIGAGASGISSVKICLDYGYEVECFEKSDNFGGVWRFKPYDCKGQASVMRSTIMNTSKEMCAFSDFPPPAEFAVFMHNRQVLEYLQLYIEKFNLLQHMKFNMEIQSVKRASDYSDTGRWVIKVKNMKTGEVKTEIYDGVMICTGHHWNPYEAEFQGLRNGTFKGRVMHVHSYKDAKGFEDKNVIVIGCGNSGTDVAVELSRTAKQVYLVTRRGSWLWNRIWEKGVPYDMAVNSHYYKHIIKASPNLFQSIMEKKLLKRFDLETYGLKPANRLFEQFICINDELPLRIASGTVMVKPNVEKFLGDQKCVFKDGTVVSNIDAVVLATGYRFDFPYLEPGVVLMDGNKIELYKYMYSPRLQHPETLAMIGLIDSIGCMFPICEMQARVFCEYIQKKPNMQLPTAEIMAQEVTNRIKALESAFIEMHMTSILVPYVPGYVRELAEMIDVQPLPPYSYLLNGDPKLAWALFFGPCLGYEYRLRGPHSWSGGRDAIVNVWNRVNAPMKTRPTPHKTNKIDQKNAVNGFLIENFKTVMIIAFLALMITMLFGF